MVPIIHPQLAWCFNKRAFIAVTLIRVSAIKQKLLFREDRNSCVADSYRNDHRACRLLWTSHIELKVNICICRTLDVCEKNFSPNEPLGTCRLTGSFSVLTALTHSSALVIWCTIFVFDFIEIVGPEFGKWSARPTERRKTKPPKVLPLSKFRSMQFSHFLLWLINCRILIFPPSMYWRAEALTYFPDLPYHPTFALLLTLGDEDDFEHPGIFFALISRFSSSMHTRINWI